MRKESGIDGKELFVRFMPGGMCQCLDDDHLTILWMSEIFCELTGYTEEEIRDRFDGHFLDLISEPDRETVMRVSQKQKESLEFMEQEYRIVRKDGTLLWVLDRGRFYRTPDGRDTFLCFLMDITVRKKMEEELRLNLERYQVIMDQTTNIIFEWDIKKDTLFFSSNWEKKFGYRAIEKRISSELPFSARIHSDDMAALLAIMEDMRQGRNYEETEFRIANLMGEFIWCRIRSTAQYNEEGEPIKAVGVILDIQEEKQRQQELMKAAHHDALTGLLNKAETGRRTEKYLSGEYGSKYREGALLLMDLDDFKRINDRYGHLCGDAVLSDTGAVLRRLFPGDVIGRVGGDEFLLFLPGTDKENAARKAGRISVYLKKKQLPDPSDEIRASVGVAGWPEDADSFSDLYRKADMALYHGKALGKNNVTLFDEESCRRKGKADMEPLRSGTVIESEDMTDVERQLVSYTFRMLYQSQNIEEAVDQLLEIVGRSYAVSRVYIFESTPDGKYCNNTFEWCNEGIEPQKDFLQNISYEEDLNGYTGNFNQRGIFYCEDVSKLDKKLYDILEPQGVKAMLQCAIIDDRDFKGYVGFDECRNNRYWTKEQIKSLGLIANILSEFLLKYRLKEQIQKLMEEQKEKGK